MKPTTKSSGPAFRQARMEGPSPQAPVGTTDPRLGGLRSAGPVGGQAGPGTSGPAASMTGQGGQTAEASYGATKTVKTVGPKHGKGPGGIGLSGRGAPIT